MFNKRGTCLQAELRGLDVRDPGKHLVTSIFEDGRFLKVVPCLEKPSKADQIHVIWELWILVAWWDKHASRNPFN